MIAYNKWHGAHHVIAKRVSAFQSAGGMQIKRFIGELTNDKKNEQ